MGSAACTPRVPGCTQHEESVANYSTGRRPHSTARESYRAAAHYSGCASQILHGVGRAWALGRATQDRLWRGRRALEQSHGFSGKVTQKSHLLHFLLRQCEE